MDPYELSSTRGSIGGNKAVGRAMAPIINDIYEEMEKQLPIDRPTRRLQYIPPHRRNQVTMEELETKNEMLEQARRQALMQITASQMAYETNVKQQIGPATQLLSDIDLSSPDAVNQILKVRNEYPMAFQDKEFYNTTVAPLVRVNEQYIKDIPKPKTDEEVMEEVLKLRAKQQEILKMFGAKGLDDLREKGDSIDVRLYEGINRKIDELLPPQAPQQVAPPPAQGATQQQGGGGALGWLKGIIGE